MTYGQSWARRKAAPVLAWQSSVGKNMTKWEYKIERISDDAGDALWRDMNDLGKQGWELVSVVTGDGEYFAYFKRPKDSQH